MPATAPTNSLIECACSATRPTEAKSVTKIMESSPPVMLVTPIISAPVATTTNIPRLGALNSTITVVTMEPVVTNCEAMCTMKLKMQQLAICTSSVCSNLGTNSQVQKVFDQIINKGIREQHRKICADLVLPWDPGSYSTVSTSCWMRKLKEYASYLLALLAATGKSSTEHNMRQQITISVYKGWLNPYEEASSIVTLEFTWDPGIIVRCEDTTGSEIYNEVLLLLYATPQAKLFLPWDPGENEKSMQFTAMILVGTVGQVISELISSTVATQMAWCSTKKKILQLDVSPSPCRLLATHGQHLYKIREQQSEN